MAILPAYVPAPKLPVPLSFKVPAVIFAVERFPLTPSGKIRKVELRQWAKDDRMEKLA